MHRTHLKRFVRQQLRNDAWAEVTYSETLIAALEKLESFDNWSQL
jgi:DNA-directed RNA polymerase specialized sigma24 family protein